ncbi:MAG: tRNA dihydrouridine synthase DusB [Verrucomicrobiota bacterium]|nr:tRNA dihydrouridine synthase DusB [Verrucomicrobiota bacterium]
MNLETNLFLSPLAGYTNLPMRLTLREQGGLGLATTDLVNARSLIEKNRKALKLIESRPEDRPLAVQLFGSVPEEMRDAAVFLEENGVQAIDINMGCPVKKVCAVGGGSAMMKEVGTTQKLVKMMVDAIKIPLTCKMRLGWDDNNLTAPDLSKALEDCGVKALFVHGRTREQGFSGFVKLKGIQMVVDAVKIPVIGNGDVTTPQAAQRMINDTGCAGVSIGRGAFYNPWIFLHTDHFLRTGELLPDPTFDERLVVMSRHFERMIEVYGEELGVRMFRKVGPWYSRKFGPSNFFNKRVVLLNTRQEYHELLEAYRTWRSPFLDERGEVKLQYSQIIPGSVFAEDVQGIENAGQSQGIPVPKGAVDTW